MNGETIFVRSVAQKVYRRGRKLYGAQPGKNASRGTRGPSCPACGNDFTSVSDSRKHSALNAVRRRRCCMRCQFRFTTYEMIAGEQQIDYQI